MVNELAEPSCPQWVASRTPVNNGVLGDRFSTPCGSVSTQGTTVFRPRCAGVVDAWKDVTYTFRSGRAQPPNRERLGFPENLRGARARRTRRQKGADCGPPPDEHLPDEPSEFRLPAP